MAPSRATSWCTRTRYKASRKASGWRRRRSEPFATAVQAVAEITQVRIGETALVSGPGPIGLLCLKLLVAEGIRAIVAGASGDGARLEAALRIGAAAVVNTGERSLQDAINEETGGAGVDAALECAGPPDSVRGSIEAVRPMGRYTQVASAAAKSRFPSIVSSSSSSRSPVRCATPRGPGNA